MNVFTVHTSVVKMQYVSTVHNCFTKIDVQLFCTVVCTLVVHYLLPVCECENLAYLGAGLCLPLRRYLKALVRVPFF